MFFASDKQFAVYSGLSFVYNTLIKKTVVIKYCILIEKSSQIIMKTILAAEPR